MAITIDYNRPIPDIKLSEKDWLEFNLRFSQMVEISKREAKENGLYKVYEGYKPYLEDIQYPSICQSCVYTYHPVMMTGFSIEGECDICKHYSELAIVKKNW